VAYARDPKIREAVKIRAAGKCEYCGQPGFICSDGTAYLECHHIIALANDGQDRMTNVIALCPGDHREAHFGKRRDELEKEMVRKVMIAERARRESNGQTSWIEGMHAEKTNAEP
jgi:5-methylcytosine-specific restriction endonuclease McrA